MSKLKIKRKTEKEVKGGYIKLSFLCISEDGGEEWVGCFKNNTSASWKEGDVIDHPVKSREYNGKTYYDFVFEKGQSSKSVASNNQEDFDEVKNMLGQIMKELIEIKLKLNFPAKETKTEEEPPPFGDEDIPEEPNDLPF